MGSFVVVANCVNAAVDMGVTGALSTLSLTLMDANNSSLIAVVRGGHVLIRATVHVVVQWADDWR